MKKYLRSYLVNLASLLLVAWLINSIAFTEGAKTVLIAAFVLMVGNVLARPVLNLLLLPINLLTLGLFRWLINIFIFYLMTLIVPQVQVAAWTYPGYANQGFTIPEISFSFFWTLFIVCFIISLSTSFLHWAFKK